MTCLRCDGLMVHEKFEDLDGLWSSDHEFTGWRCHMWGHCRSRDCCAQAYHLVRGRIQALTTEHEALSSWTDRLADHLTVQKRRVCHD